MTNIITIIVVNIIKIFISFLSLHQMLKFLYHKLEVECMNFI